MNKIALLRANPKDAGMAKILIALSKEYKVDCYVWDRQRDYQPIVEHQDIKYVKCKIRAGFHNIGTFIKLLLFETWLFLKLLFARADCIHAIDLDTGLVGLCAAKLRGKYFVYQCLDPYYAALPENWPKFLSLIGKKIEALVISNADIFIITDLLRLPQHEGAKPKEIVEIANVPFLNTSKIISIKDGEFVTGYIGSLVEGRNLKTIVNAVGELKDKGVKLIIGGFGPLEDPIKQLSEKYQNVIYTKWIPYTKVLEIESSFDIFIHITDKDNEGQKWVSPNKLFESMVFSKPIIVGKETLAAKRVASIGNGVAIRYASEEELKKAILRFKNNPHLIQEIGEKGKNEFDNNWSLEVMERRLLEAYRKLVR